MSDLRPIQPPIFTHSPTGLAIGILIAIIAIGSVGVFAWKSWTAPAPQHVVADTRLPSPSPPSRL